MASIPPGEIRFDRQAYALLPMPLAATYRKAYNSIGNPSALHANALSFGLCLLRFLASVSICLVREGMRGSPRHAELVSKLHRPSDGDWQRWCGDVLSDCVEGTRDSPALSVALVHFLARRLQQGLEPALAATDLLQSYLSGSCPAANRCTVNDFLLLLVRYRNALGHGAPLDRDEDKSVHGSLLLRGVLDLARNLPLKDNWELAQATAVSLGTAEPVCDFTGLVGGDAIRIEPRRFAGRMATPVAGRVYLLPSDAGSPPLDLHPLVVRREDQVLFFNGLIGSRPGYLDFAEGGAARAVPEVAGDVECLEGVLRAAFETGPASAPGLAEGHESLAGGHPEGRFRIERHLGIGGMGAVELAFDKVLKRKVAIKRIRGRLKGNSAAVKRFLEEAQHTARLNHPNVVSILTIDQDDDGPFIVMEHVEGGSLRKRLQEGPLSLPESLSMLRQLLGGLMHAHERGLVHRDIKPENVLLTESGVPKLADFGLALDLDGEEREEQAVPGFEGTRPYAAPELLREGAAPDFRSDLFAMGVTFYEMVTGRAPAPLRLDKVPSSVTALLMRLLDRNPNLRFESLAAALAACREVERSLELASRDAEESRRRCRETVLDGFRKAASGGWIDARGCFERVLAELPGDAAGTTGLALVHLAIGEMVTFVRLYQDLVARECDHPVFLGMRRNLESFPSPADLWLSPMPSPFGYAIGALREGRLQKDLVRHDREHLNLGDVGEILVALSERVGAAPGVRLRESGALSYRVHFDLPETSIEASYAIRVQRRLFGFPDLQNMLVKLRVEGQPLAIYRVIRYVARELATRMRRAPGTWLDPAIARENGVDADAAMALWSAVDLPFQALAMEAER